MICDSNLLQMTGKLLLNTAEWAALMRGRSFHVTTQASQVPALTHMELCLLLAAIALKKFTPLVLKPLK